MAGMEDCVRACRHCAECDAGCPYGAKNTLDVTYLADTVVLLRYFEANGAVRQTISVVKKRTGDHERTIRESRVERGGLHVGSPLREFQGVLGGVPSFVGSTGDLMAATTPPGSRPDPAE